MTIRRFPPFPLAALAAFTFASVSGFAQSILQSASNYALLGGTLISVGGPGPNAITNGNVGLWSAATSNITGFPPATVSGITSGGLTAAIIATGPLTTGQAYADVQKAHVGLAGMASSVNVSNVNLGTMAPLFSGVYTFNGAAQQTGALVLDAQGQNGVTWVFQIGTSLTTGVNSTVTFINLGTNGGSDLGVFWNAGAGITIGDNNTILGNYLAGTSISFTGSTNTMGAGGARAMALAGITFAGPGSINALGGPGGGDFSGGLAYDANGAVVTVNTSSGGPTTPSGGDTGTVLVSDTGTVTPSTSGSAPVEGTPLATSTTTIDGNIADGSAPASLTVTTATVTLTGNNTYTGGTTVSGGTLIAGSGNLPTNRDVVLENSGSLVFNQPTDGSFGGVISGDGAVIKQGSGALTVTGGNTHTGGTVVNDGSLIANTSSLPAGQVVSVKGSGVLVFNQATDGTYSGFLTGGGQVQKQGAGKLTLTQPTLSPLDLQTGSVYFNQSLGPTTIAAGAFLGGNGTISGNLTNRGTVSPGNSPGTITVTGNYLQTGTGTLVIEFASVTSFDQLVVGGTAALAGTLQLDLLNSYAPVGQSFTFLTASGGVSGTFQNITGNAMTNRAAIVGSLSYAPNAVAVQFTQRLFAELATTSNQLVLANAVQFNPEIKAALNAVPLVSQFPGALNAISPQGYQVWSDLAFVRDSSLADRMLKGVALGDEYYFEAGYSRGRSSADQDVGSSKYRRKSALVGGNMTTGLNTTIGAFVAVGKTTSGMGLEGSETTQKSQTLGLRSGWTNDQFFAEAMLSYSTHRYSATRPIVFPGTSTIAASSTRGHQWTTAISVGKHVNVGEVRVTPFGGLLASRWSVDGFRENGAGAFGSTISGQSADSLRGQIGAEARMTFGIFQPHVRAAWLHEFSNDSRVINASLNNVNYAVAIRSAEEDSALYSAGLNVALSPTALIYTNVSTQSGGTTRVVSDWHLGLAVRF